VTIALIEINAIVRSIAPPTSLPIKAINVSFVIPAPGYLTSGISLNYMQRMGNNTCQSFWPLSLKPARSIFPLLGFLPQPHALSFFRKAKLS